MISLQSKIIIVYYKIIIKVIALGSVMYVKLIMDLLNVQNVEEIVKNMVYSVFVPRVIMMINNHKIAD